MYIVKYDIALTFIILSSKKLILYNLDFFSFCLIALLKAANVFNITAIMNCQDKGVTLSIKKNFGYIVFNDFNIV